MKLFLFENDKLWRKSVSFICLLGLAFCNLLLLFADTKLFTENIPPSAWKEIGQDMRELGEKEKTLFIDEKLELISVIIKIEQTIKTTAENGGNDNDDNITEADMALLDKYGIIYHESNYTLYCDNELQEFFFLTKIKQELNAVSAYDDFLKEIRNNANAMSGMPIFNENGSYDTLSMAATLKAYENIDSIIIEYAPQEGLYKALEYPFTDLVALFGILLLASLLIRQERENGMLGIIRTMPGGRAKTAFAKISCFALAIFILIITLYGVNLFYFSATYGLGPMGRSIQSVPALMRCTMPISVRKYICFFLLAKWAAAFIFGLWVMLACLVCKKSVWAWCLAFTLPAMQLIVRLAIPATSKWNILKYSNIVSISRTNELLGSYRNLYFFGRPLPLALAGAITGIASAFSFTVIFVLFLTHSPIEKPVQKEFSLSNVPHKNVKHTTIIKEEMYKTLLANSILIILFAFLAVQIYRSINSNSFLSARETYYKEYMTELSGPYTEKKHMWIKNQEEAFGEIKELEKMFANGEINEMDFSQQMELNSPLLLKKQIYNEITTYKTDMLWKYYGSHMVYETGYEQFFDFGGQNNLASALLCSILSIFSLSGIFAIEKNSGMFKILKTTPLGQKKTVKTKLFIGCVVSVFICVVSLIPRIWLVLRDFGLPAIFSPAMSLEEFRHLPVFIPLAAILMFFLLTRLLACFAMGCTILLLSHKLGNSLYTMLSSMIIFSLPLLLAVSGFKGIEYFTFFPLFNFPAMLLCEKTILIGLFYLFMAVIVIFLSCRHLFKSYKIPV